MGAAYRGRLASGEGRALLVENGMIRAIEPCDGTGLPWLAPALVDLQVNGFLGLDLNEGELVPETVLALCEVLAARGVGCFLPTLITAPAAAIVQRLTAISEATRHPLAAAMIAGVHVEGPMISPEDGPRGAHPRDHVRALTLAELDDWQAASGGLLRLVTLAPEIAGAMPLIRALAGRGILVAIGHSAASPAQIREAVAAGARISTHLGNGAAAMLPRHPNLIWAQLAEDALSAGLIADGDHLPDATLKSMLRAKAGRAFLVSDSVGLAGMPPGRYENPIGGAVEIDASGKISVAGTPYLAGSGHALVEFLGRVPAATGLPLGAVLDLATTAPAALIGRDVALRAGGRADFILFDWSPEAPVMVLRDSVIAGERRGP